MSETVEASLLTQAGLQCSELTLYSSLEMLTSETKCGTGDCGNVTRQTSKEL